ncbi:hypothetical protein [Desulfobacca acetoxidans]|nr:hypothetical protein [Desulfobacca acetoxidans]
MSLEIFFVVEEAAEGGYEAKALGHSIYTQGETLEEVREAVKDAVVILRTTRYLASFACIW